jgi:hypothetical protein
LPPLLKASCAGDSTEDHPRDDDVASAAWPGHVASTPMMSERWAVVVLVGASMFVVLSGLLDDVIRVAIWELSRHPHSARGRSPAGISPRVRPG